MGALIDSQPGITAETREGTPLSQVIRQRLRKAGVSFRANDNIAAHLREGEADGLQQEVALHIENALRALVIDVDNDHNTHETAKRVAKMFVKEVFSGRYEPPPPITEFPNVGHLNELTLIGPLRVRSACSHHLCPIMGHAWIGILPNANSNLPGLSKYARLLNWVMARPQIQEEAVKQIADLLEEKIGPDGIAVVMEADHYCMHWRGTKDDGARMVSSVMRGRFLEDPALRREFLSLMPKRPG
ncbi:GTP cyclohydrolase I [Bordetella avium]|uniref:GTP cyclohydrolase I n=1 Tax=Bordetella avium (strain 197N) TaxID=360910 RepID=Q2L1Q0_BORA1|nr:GTP cyclohydrolase I [Bordetella avium]AZY48982.1 GTP cyclohydrolase I [Bordetella avium]AZY52343.1 GTP cyclohydrolase I [Bordetella avium]RIQ14225.1 GTP cyclohydrolase I [Bordetella avium]RIQ18101.1 GTP cyclohydrolase I [Bordetella avium]RIQ36573.1 GTP cyclohydrolase I [Bordetella avium]